MANVPQEETKRNQELITDYQKRDENGFAFSTAQLVGKYGISSTRIYEILAKYNVPRRSLKGKIE